MNKIVILDPSCVDDSRTHHLSAIMGHIKAFHASGFEVILASNRQCSESIFRVKHYPVFNYTIYDDIRLIMRFPVTRHLKSPYYQYLKFHIKKTIRKLIEIESLNSEDHIFIPTTDWLIFQSLFSLSTTSFNFPNLHFIIMYEKANWITGGYPYEKIINLLSSTKLGETIHVYTETKKHSQNLSKHIPYAPDNYPYPAQSFDIYKNNDHSSNKIIICSLGGGRRDKGFSRLPEIIRTFNKIYPDYKEIQFLVQEPRQVDSLSNALDALDATCNVNILSNHISRNTYCETLLNSSVALFPYSEVYASRGSGVVNEAIANAIPLICSSDTSLTEAITNNNGIAATTDQEFAEGIKNIIINMNEFRDNAVKAKQQYYDRYYNNPVIETIRRCKSNTAI